MTILNRWHWRWLAHAAACPDDPILTQVIAGEHWRGWTAEVARQHRGLDKARARLATWHLRWLLAEVDALVTAGRVEFQEDAIVLDTDIVFRVNEGGGQ